MATALNFERATRVVARNLGVTPLELRDSLHNAGPADLEDILALRQSVFGTQPAWDDRRYMQWRYALAPGTSSYATYRVLRIHGQIVAGIGAEEFRLLTPSGSVDAACAMDILALEQYWNAGIGGWLNLALFNYYPLTLALGSNANSRGLVRSLYNPMYSRSELQFPLDARDFMEKRLRLPGAGAVAGRLASTLLSLRTRWYLARARDRSERVRELLRFPGDAPFNSALATEPGRTALVRSPGYLNWRYMDNPRARYRACGWFEEDLLRGYVIFGSDMDSTGARATCVVDWWVAGERDPVPLRALMAEVVGDAVRNKSRLVRVRSSGEPLIQQLRRAGFVRESPGGAAAGWRSSENTGFAPHDTGSWCLTGLGDDSDVSDYRQ